MVLCFNSGTYQTLDNHQDGIFFFQYYYTILNVYLTHFQFEITHNILDMDNIYV